MTVTDAFLAICLSAHMSTSSREVRKTVKRCQRRLPLAERHKLDVFRNAHNPREAILIALSVL